MANSVVKAFGGLVLVSGITFNGNENGIEAAVMPPLNTAIETESDPIDQSSIIDNDQKSDYETLMIDNVREIFLEFHDYMSAGYGPITGYGCAGGVLSGILLLKITSKVFGSKERNPGGYQIGRSIGRHDPKVGFDRNFLTDLKKDK